jgi:peptidoglycan/xylan/chitin deacetylase (PgdA/CDA1 family)
MGNRGNVMIEFRYIRKMALLSIAIIIGIISVANVSAFIPVKYVCCYNYSSSEGFLINGFEDTTSSGIQLDDFGNISNWTVGGIGASEQVDTDNFIYGSQGIKLIATNGNRAYIDKLINNNFSTSNNFVVWLYVYNASSIAYATIYLTSNYSGQTWNSCFDDNIFNLRQGWNKLIFNKNEFTNGCSSPENWNNIMTKLRLAIWPPGGSNINTNATFDNLRYNMTNDWIVGGSGAYIQPDTVNFKEGTQGDRLVATNGTAYMDLQINNQFSNINNFGIWAYADNASAQNGMTFYITSGGSGWNKYFYDSEFFGIKSGWNHLIFNKHNFRNIGGEDWNNTMNRIRLRTWPQSTNLNFTLDDLTFNMTGQRAKIMFEFDDGDISQYQKAFPILQKNNESGTAFVVTNWIDGTGLMSVANLQTLQSAGWDIGSHSLDHPDLTTLSDSALTSELNDSYAWLVANGFQKSASFIAYPYGNFNDNVIAKTQQRYLFGRATVPEGAQQYISDSDNTIQDIQRLIESANTSVQTITDQINDSINAKLLTIVLFHVINDTNPTNDPYTFLTSDFQKVSNYIKSRSADTDVITYSDNYVYPWINNFTPVLNKITRIYSNGTSQLITSNKYDEYMSNTTIIPSSDYIDVNMSNMSIGDWQRIGINESLPNSNINVSYTIGDLLPNWTYYVNVTGSDGKMYNNFNISSNGTGYINYYLAGFPGYPTSRYQDISGALPIIGFSVTLPTGYSDLTFNASNATFTNLNPEGQSTTQPFFNITNIGNEALGFTLYLIANPPNINTYVDLNNNFSTGRIPITSTVSSVIIPNLAPQTSQNIWMLADANIAPPSRTNGSLNMSGIIKVPEYVSNNCDPNLWTYVWGEDQKLTTRLLLNTTYSCINVSGTIDNIVPESDADTHMYLFLDPQYLPLTDEIDLEVVCSNANITGTPECYNNNFNQSYLMKNITNGVHVSVTGAYIIDTAWGGHEIHPVTSIGPVILGISTNPTFYKKVGDKIQYNYNLKNTGNSVLNGFSVTDNKTGLVPCPGDLNPGQSLQCSTNYSITQRDITNGTISNFAYVSIVSNGTIINSNIARATIYKQ